MRTTRKRALTLTAAAASVALLATGCGGGKDDDKTGGSGDGATSDEKVTLTISTFNEWGYDALLDQYMQEHPNVTIDHNKFATSNEARDQFNTSLAAGSGLTFEDAGVHERRPEDGPSDVLGLRVPRRKLVASAVANAEENFGVSRDDLVVSQIYANEAPTRKWRRFGARGRFKPILRRTSHVTIVLRERETA